MDFNLITILPAIRYEPHAISSRCDRLVNYHANQFAIVSVGIAQVSLDVDE